MLVEAGVPAPAVGQIIEVEDRRGLEYERVDGPSMEAYLEQHPGQGESMARHLARLHASMHRPLAAPLPSQRDKVVRAIGSVPSNLLPAHLKNKALQTLDTLPDGQMLCHGDFHPGNVLLGSGGPRIIDWENACLGSPAADVGRTCLLLSAAHIYYPPDTPIGQALDAFSELYLQEYIALTGIERAEIDSWRVPLAAARLAEGIEEENTFLASLVENG
jgi:aminoglycoside phosphotransferase (APT) family kinase protein